MSPPSAPHVVYLGVSWTDAEPRLRVRSGEAAASDLVPAVGHEFRHRTLDGRVCLGHVSRSADGVVLVDCHRNPDDGPVCRRCRTAENVFAASFHRAHLLERHQVDTRVRSTFAQAHVLYLAAFRDGSIKVGTSVEARRMNRLAEQGAWMAVLMARTADGYTVRELEDAVTGELGIAQAVAGSRKMAGLLQPMADEELRQRLEREAARVARLVGGARWAAADPTEVWWSPPSATAPIWDEVHPYPLTFDSGNHRLIVVAMCGRFAAARSPQLDAAFAVDLGPLFGRWVQPDELDSDALAVQASLF